MSVSSKSDLPGMSPSPFRTPRQRAEEREVKRDALLLAAARIFSEKGFYAASLEDVAALLGVTKPMIYHYLGNKEQVLFECIKMGMTALHQAVESAREQHGRGIDRLRAFLRAYALTNMTDFGRCVIFASEEMLSPESATRFRTLKREIDTALRRLLMQCVDEESIEVEDPKLTAFSFFGALNWPARWYDPSGPLPPEKIADSLVEGLLRGILPRSGRAAPATTGAPGPTKKRPKQ